MGGFRLYPAARCEVEIALFSSEELPAEEPTSEVTSAGKVGCLSALTHSSAALNAELGGPLQRVTGG